MNQYLREKMTNIKSWIVKEKYFLLLLLCMSISLFISMFFELGLILSSLIMLLGAIAFNFEKGLCIFLFCFSFEAVFYIGNKTSVFAMFYTILFSIYFLKYFIKILKKEKQLNIKLIVPLLLMLVYVVIPFNTINIKHIIKYVVALGFIYLLLENKKEINFDNILIVACVGLILSLIFSLFIPLSSRMCGLIQRFFNNGIQKTQAMFSNPNLLAPYAALVLSWIVYRFITGDILWVIPLTILLFYSYATLSRNLMICLLLIISFLILFVCIKKKKTYVLRLCTFLGIVFVVCLSCFELTKVHFERFKSIFLELFDLLGIKLENNVTSVWVEDDILPEEIINPGYDLWIDGTRLDPGRVGLWKRYLRDYASSAKTILFGRGISAVLLGMSTHNTFIEIIWRLGLLGSLILCSVFYLIGREIFKSKFSNSTCILLLILFINICEACLFNSVALMMIIFFIGNLESCDEQKEIQNIEEYKVVGEKKQNTKQQIPKKIHYIWLGGKEEPEILTKCKESWKKYCPDYEIIRWDESNLDLDCCEYCGQAYNSKKFAFASDVVRFDILYKEGGIYLDIDVELLKSLDDLLEHKCFMGFEHKGALNPGLIMGAQKKCKTVKELFDSYKEDKFIMEDGSFNMDTICTRTTHYLQNKGLKLDNTRQTIDEVEVYPTEYFCPINPITDKKKITDNTYSVHLYYASWFSRKTKLKKLVKRILNFVTNGMFGIWVYKHKCKKEK